MCFYYEHYYLPVINFTHGLWCGKISTFTVSHDLQELMKTCLFHCISKARLCGVNLKHFMSQKKQKLWYQITIFSFNHLCVLTWKVTLVCEESVHCKVWLKFQRDINMSSALHFWRCSYMYFHVVTHPDNANH